mmetsp:Transcript_46804/g.114015  ORF Transcript_46804/g.114015 Transcript_46804/m.114015 type:complete len:249 (+) Transcript_46804:1589-2335(+)
MVHPVRDDPAALAPVPLCLFSVAKSGLEEHLLLPCEHWAPLAVVARLLPPLLELWVWEGHEREQVPCLCNGLLSTLVHLHSILKQANLLCALSVLDAPRGVVSSLLTIEPAARLEALGLDPECHLCHGCVTCKKVVDHNLREAWLKHEGEVVFGGDLHHLSRKVPLRGAGHRVELDRGEAGAQQQVGDLSEQLRSARLLLEHDVPLLVVEPHRVAHQHPDLLDGLLGLDLGGRLLLAPLLIHRDLFRE